MKKILSVLLALTMSLSLTTMAWADGDGSESNPYTLEQFNALTKISGTVYVDLTGAALEGGLTIGNVTMADHYNYTNWDDHTAPEGYPYDTGRTNTRGSDGATRYLYSTGKDTVKLILVGTVTGANDTGKFNAGTIKLQVPDATDVTFQGVTFGEGQMAVGAWSESFQSTVVDHRISSITFNGCKFYGNWLQDGSVGTDTMSFVNKCIFYKYENTVDSNNSNPIWIQNMGHCDVTFDNCEVNACRPLKLWENNVSGDVVIKNTTFNMSKGSGDDESTHKNVAIMFSKINWELGDIEIKDNTVLGDATGLICFYDKNDFRMSAGSSFTVSNNQLPAGAETSVKWKDSAAYGPDEMNITLPQPPTPTPADPAPVDPTPEPTRPVRPDRPARRYPTGTTTATGTETAGTDITSAKTFDAGIALYIGMSALSLSGSALLLGKKKEF